MSYLSITQVRRKAFLALIQSWIIVQKAASSLEEKEHCSLISMAVHFVSSHVRAGIHKNFSEEFIVEPISNLSK